VDEAQLLLDTAPRDPDARYRAPESELEKALADIWSQALGRPRVGRDDSFFGLGGNSLRAARLLALTHQKLGVRVTTHALYEAPTVAGMATAIEHERAC